MTISEKIVQVRKTAGDRRRAMERRFYVNGKFYNHLVSSPEELAGKIHATIERVEPGFDCLLGEHEIVYLKVE